MPITDRNPVISIRLTKFIVIIQFSLTRTAFAETRVAITGYAAKQIVDCEVIKTKLP